MSLRESERGANKTRRRKKRLDVGFLLNTNPTDRECREYGGRKNHKDDDGKHDNNNRSTLAVGLAAQSDSPSGPCVNQEQAWEASAARRR